jgi:murein DD-endopeptidase MepM/ murein hydrolase activator NlpD
MDETKKKSLWQRLRETYRISVLNEDTLAEKWYLHLSGWGAIVITGLLFVITLVLFSLVILYTPIRNYLPGYSENIRQQLVEESTRIDSLGTSLEMQRQYLGIIKQVMAGEVHSDTVQSLDSMQIIMREQLLEAKKEATEEFIAQYEEKEKNNMQLFAGNTNQNIPITVFFVPIHGAITQHFSIQEKQYGILISTMDNENVASVLNGVVMYVNCEINNVHTMIIKHTDYMSIYRGLKRPLKQIGERVQAGECIGIAREGQLGYELWKNDLAVDPEKLIAF